MRSVKLSITFVEQLNELLAQGEERFGPRVTEDKKSCVYSTIRHQLARYPATRRRDPDLGMCIYPETGTPFVLVYDYDDAEIRVHFILHARADRTLIDPRKAEW